MAWLAWLMAHHPGGQHQAERYWVAHAMCLSPFLSPNPIWHTPHRHWFFRGPPLERLRICSQHPQAPKALWRKSFCNWRTDFRRVVVLVLLYVCRLLLPNNLGNSIFHSILGPPPSKYLVLGWVETSPSSPFQLLHTPYELSSWQLCALGDSWMLSWPLSLQKPSTCEERNKWKLIYSSVCRLCFSWCMQGEMEDIKRRICEKQKK